MNVRLFKHQQQLVQAPWLYQNLEYFFLIGGYGCGKSFGIVGTIFRIIQRYDGTFIRMGLGATSITLLRKTVISELAKVLNEAHIPYKDNSKENILRIGSIEIVLIATQQPELIYAYNFSIFICDEIDELPLDKTLTAFKAIQERTRVLLPDGRDPFSVFTSTAQGYSGLYTIVEELKELNVAHLLIRGRTKDNTSLSESYYKRLLSLYSPNEQEAFLEGKFINIYTGKVYGDFNESIHRVPDIKVNMNDEIHIGQDMNAGYSKAVMFVKRDRLLYAVDTVSLKNIGDAPSVFRTMFPTNPITWYPDASSKEVMAAYASEIRRYDIQLRIGTHNPSIIERIFTVNKLFKLGWLKVCDKAKPLVVALNTRAFDDTGKPEKGRGEKAPDHICDATEYVLWRIVLSDLDFSLLKGLLRSVKGEEKVA